MVNYAVEKEIVLQESEDGDEEVNLDSVPQRLTQSTRSRTKDSLERAKIKAMKKQVKDLRRVNVDLMRQLKETNELNFAYDEKDPTGTDNVRKVS